MINLRMRRLYGALCGLLYIALVSCSGQPEKVETKPAVSQAPVDLSIPAFTGDYVWTVMPDKSRIQFSAAMGGESFSGTFSRFNIFVQLDPDNPAARGKISALIDLTSVDTGNEERDTALPAEEWFNVNQYPAAGFTSDSIRKGEGPNTYIAAGTLVLKGVSAPLDLPFTLTLGDEGNMAQGDAQLTLNRLEFSIGSGPYADEDWIASQVKVNLHIEAHR